MYSLLVGLFVIVFSLYFLFSVDTASSTLKLAYLIVWYLVCMLCFGVEYTRLACNKSLPLGTYFQDHVRSLIQANHRKPHKQLALLRNVVRQLGFVVLVLYVKTCCHHLTRLHFTVYSRHITLSFVSYRFVSDTIGAR